MESSYLRNIFIPLQHDCEILNMKFVYDIITEGKYIKDDLYYTCFIYSHVQRKRQKRKCTKMLIVGHL